MSRLYANKELIVETDFELRSPKKRLQVSEFFPLDVEILSDLWGGEIFTQGFPFAGDMWGDCYFVKVSPNALDDTPVFRYSRRENETEPIAESIAQFLGWSTAPASAPENCDVRRSFGDWRNKKRAPQTTSPLIPGVWQSHRAQ